MINFANLISFEKRHVYLSLRRADTAADIDELDSSLEAAVLNLRIDDIDLDGENDRLKMRFYGYDEGADDDDEQEEESDELYGDFEDLEAGIFIPYL